MRQFSRVMGAAVVAVLTIVPAASSQVAQEAVDLEVVQRIRQEGLENSHIDSLAWYLTEVIGPRLTGSPGMRRANEWTAEMLESWGLQNVIVEPWGEFGRGWEGVSYSGRIITPFIQPLQAHPVAWTGSTDGAVRGQVRIVTVDSVADLARYRGQLRGAIVLREAPQEIEPEFDQRERRASLDDLFGPPQTRGGGDPAARQRMRRRRTVQAEVEGLLREEGVAAILTRSSRQYGIVRGGGSTPGRDVNNPEPLPQVVVSAEQYGQMYRAVERGVPVEVEINVQNRFYSDDLQAYNTLADLPGTDKADEYIMLGAHLDSWHYGTGATDDASGSVVMMEAMRILKTLELQPRRTIRIALWSAEEQGLLGSGRWVANHPELHDKISAYVNVDNGTGRIRGIWDQDNEAAIPIFEQTLWPFRDLGVVAVRHGTTGGTDHLSFDRAGIPGFNFIQDPIEYSTRTHHTFADTFDHLMLDDLKQAAVVVAATVYQLAMRDEMVPRKPAPEATN